MLDLKCIEMSSFFECVEQALCEAEPQRKQALTIELAKNWLGTKIDPTEREICDPVNVPGRPTKPCLVAPRALPRRSVRSAQGLAALVHAIAHIEFNAINLALDAMHRFGPLPETYYHDWLHVAGEEAFHFSLINQHLQTLGYQYGDFNAHNGLWEIAQQTQDDVLVRMALVPRVFEARGLDVTPDMIEKFHSIDDHKGAEILEIILRDEIGHVEIGTRWFHYLCHQRNLDQEKTFIDLVDKYFKGTIVLPLQRDIRKKAGFTDSELNLLERLAATKNH